MLAVLLKVMTKEHKKRIAWDYFGLQKGPDGKPLDVGSIILWNLPWECKGEV